MKRKKTPGLVAVAAAALCTVQARAGIVLFDFENQPIFTETPFSMTAAGLTAAFAGPPGIDPGAFGISSNFPSPTGLQYRLMAGDFLTIGTAFGASGAALTVTFSAPVTAFMLDFALDDPANTGSLWFTTNGGGASQSSGAPSSGFRYPEGSLSFSGAPFTTVTFASNALDFQIDNLQVTAVPVPEPEVAWLLAAGLPLLAAMRRRRQGDRA